MAEMLHVRRSQGALSGAFLALLGLWGALIPFVGPYFHFAYSPDRAWAVTAGRMWLEVVPGGITLLTGVVMVISRFRLLVVLGAGLAALAGVWFAVGSLVAERWPTLPSVSTPAGTGTVRILLEELGFFTGLGLVIVFVAALAVGRLTVFGARDEADDWDDLPEDDSRELEPVGAGRSIARIVPVPVFRGRHRDADKASS